MEGIDMLAIIQEIGVVPSVVIAAFFGYLGGLFTAIVGRCIEIDKEEAQRTITDKDIKNNYDYVDWSKVPDGYNWVAISGQEEREDQHKMHSVLFRCFKNKPYIKMGSMYETWMGEEKAFDTFDISIGKLPPWRESLRRRPS